MGLNRFFNQFVLTLDKRQVLVPGTVSLSSAAAVTQKNFSDLVEDVVKTATGTYEIRMRDSAQTLRSCQLTFEGAATDVQIKLSSVSSDNKVFTVQTVVAGSVADVAAACKIHVSITLKDSTAR